MFAYDLALKLCFTILNICNDTCTCECLDCQMNTATNNTNGLLLILLCKSAATK